MSPTPDESMSASQLEVLRRQLDEIDGEIVRLLARRLSTVGDVAVTKQAEAADIRDVERERHVISRAEATAEELGISPSFVRAVFETIIEHSVALQTAHRDGPGNDGAPRFPSGTTAD
jgi:chorismate mutase